MDLECLSKINTFYKSQPRPAWDEYFLMLSFDVSLRSEDPDIKHGAIIVDEHHHIIGTGYNGPIKGSDNAQIPLNIRDEKRKWMIHAEENAILNSTKRSNNTTIYVTGQPCNNCLQRIINFGIKKIVMADRVGSITENQETSLMRDKIINMSGVEVCKIPMSNIWLQRVNFS